MARREDLIRIIVENIEENRNSWVKALFYADKDVERIMNRLVSEWSRSDMRGEPLDYATLEELEILAEKAKQYRDAPQEVFLRSMLRRSAGIEEERS